MVRSIDTSGTQRNEVDRRQRLGKLVALVADRDRRTALLVKRILFTLGFRNLDIATSGEEALQFLGERVYDMIITEWDMEPVDGLELVKAIRSAQTDARIRRDIPIVMLTAQADVDSVRVARDAGITEFVAKPFSAQTISHRMIQIIDNPRAFVESPKFVGPDRRRRGKPPEGVHERRVRTTPPALPPNTSLKAQLGGMAASEIISASVVERAQLELANFEGEFIDWAREDILA
ncbi:MAG TPA: response regulator, partial [Kofleriaceae bacterium]|nr:response regulator [Kofleriaceae bacterium]